METTTPALKTVAELTIEEAKAELIGYREKGIEVPEFTEDAKLTALRKLVTMARKQVVAETSPETPAETTTTTPTETVPESPEVVPPAEPVPPATPASTEKSVVEKTATREGNIQVVCSNGAATRLYSRREHGAVYKTLAANYAEHNKGKMYHV